MKHLLLTTIAAVVLVSADEAEPSDVFWNDLKVHRFHLEMSEAEWEAMKALDPHKGLAPAERLKKINGERRELHRSRFPWAEGSLTINGQHLNGIGARYKGNASFNLMRGSLKRNMKIKLDWTNKDQNYNSVETLNLNAGGLDPSKLRDAFSYWLFREAGVPAPRTTFAEMTLTIPGRYEKEHLGIYTIVEQVNKSFLKDRFGSKKGLLMKPEGIASVEYHGDDWRFYAPLYRPDDEPLLAQSMRVMDFANVVNLSNEKQFRDSISSYLDIDGFLRFIAVNALIVNLDTLLAMPQNYYLHLSKDTNKFVFFPWDLDISFAGWPLGGKPADQMKLSLVHPHSSDAHKLIDRLLAMEPVKLRYDKIISQLVEGIFSKEQLIKKFEKLERTILDSRERDTAAIESRNERGYPAPRGYQPPGIREFIDKRTSSIKRQLNGKETGYIFVHRRPGGRLGHLAQGGFGRGRLAMHMLIQGDLNEDKSISKKELLTMLSGWFDAMDREKAGKLNKAAFIKALPDAFFPSGRKPLGRIPEPYVAVGLFSLADSDEDGMATKQSLTSSFDGLFEKLAPGNSGKLNEHSLMIGLQSLIHQSRNGGEKR
jgi:spore coat protein CotH